MSYSTTGIRESELAGVSVYTGASINDVQWAAEETFVKLSDVEAMLAARTTLPPPGVAGGTARASATAPAPKLKSEAARLAKILFGMIGSADKDSAKDIYADVPHAANRDTYVNRAAELLVEQAAEIEMLVQTLDLAGNQLAEARDAAQTKARTYTREEVEKWRADVAHAAANMVQRASASFGSGDWSWLVNAVRGLARSGAAPAQRLDIETLLYEHERAVIGAHEHGDTGGFHSALESAKNDLRAALTSEHVPAKYECRCGNTIDVCVATSCQHSTLAVAPTPQAASYAVSVKKFGKKGSGEHLYVMSDGSTKTMREDDALRSVANHANSLRAKDTEIARLRAVLATQASQAYEALRNIRDTAYFDSSVSGGVYYRKAENALAAIEGRDAEPSGAATPAEPVAVHQWRKRVPKDSPWHDADKGEAYARVDDFYEARTVHVVPEARQPGELRTPADIVTIQTVNTTTGQSVDWSASRNAVEAAEAAVEHAHNEQSMIMRCPDCLGPLGEDHSETCGIGRGPVLEKQARPFAAPAAD